MLHSLECPEGHNSGGAGPFQQLSSYYRHPLDLLHALGGPSGIDPTLVCLQFWHKAYRAGEITGCTPDKSHSRSSIVSD